MKIVLFLALGVLFSAGRESSILFILSTLEDNIKVLSGNKEVDNLHQVDDIITYASVKYGLDSELIKAVIQIESGGNHTLMSAKGAIGIMQLMPGTAADLGVNPHSRFDNIMGGSNLLKQLVDRWGLHDGLQAYNCGSGNVVRNTIPAESHRYAHKVMKLYEKLKSETR